MHFIFDLDGTISDSYPGIDRGFRHALSRLNHESANQNNFHEFIGAPLQLSFSRILSVPVEETRNAVDLFRNYYSEYGWKENNIYAGMHELLTELHKTNSKLSLVTNKPTLFAEKILSHFGIRTMFTSVLGQELGYVPVNKAELLFKVLDTSLASIYIGDTIHDIEASAVCNIPVVAVGYGYGNSSQLAKAQPDHFVESVADLRRCLLKLAES